ncbi:MAG: hypothetical protein QNJ33_03300 [Crocosphaera sp.]|nr:hypothetical protein [Crocosphaera sp.]
MTTIEIKDLEIVTENTCETVEAQEVSLVIGGCGGMTDVLLPLPVPPLEPFPVFTTLDSVACCLTWA